MSDGERSLVVAGTAVEALLRMAALVDLKGRPAEQVRGPRWAWAVGLATVSSFGVLPIAYFAVGRRRAAD